ncbi:hypothetical protein [Agrobacterium tumefaciens]|uniref:Uncharacterized protein n=1 Tax=Agrobacterium tumefaciens TaxID=358 RepID=A0AA44F1M1_AGRTU|nr:hypothetical protein [Agrobacterium tumefaciens]NSL22892.1 hypothetical protein [Agrobacterium tumefaciens]NTB84100.1 hypothetical protein [Agrobacterium tumefaciens]NTC20201.1 hypothetical protein [Agrobacterium tumefaciens]NTC27408.1 hypothetical protein [Agrobacterium tumefaciens]NTC56721.1 hypothetical protein [Agrobacterium tumefaciens]
MTRSQTDFYELIKEYKTASAFYQDNVEQAESDEASGILVLRDVVGRILLEPCAAPEEMVRKVSFILSENFLVEWLGEESDMVRMLLSSFMCLKDV